MNIIVVTDYSLNCSNGVARSAIDLSQQLALRGEKVLLVTGNENNTIQQISDNLKNVGIQSSIRYNSSFVRITRGNKKFLLDIVREFKPEMIHSHGEGVLSSLLLLYAAKGRIPFVSTSHTLPQNLTSFVSNPILRFGIAWVTRVNFINNYLKNFYKHSDIVFTSSKFGLENLKSFKIGDKIKIIPNAIDLNKYSYTKQKSKSNDKFIDMLTVGNPDKRKNTLFLVNVMKYLPKNFILRIAGDSYDKKYLQDIMGITRKYALNIQILGKVAHDDVIKILQRSELYLSSSLIEVQSIAIIEALASGVPVVGLKNLTIDELIDSNTGINLPQTTTEKKFADKILSLIRNDTIYAKFRENSKKIAKMHDWETILPKYIDAYDFVIRNYSSKAIKKPSFMFKISIRLVESSASLVYHLTKFIKQ